MAARGNKRKPGTAPARGRTRQSKLPPLEQAREQVMRLLAVRSRARRELELRLRDKGFSSELISDLLDRLVETGLLDDGRFACDRARAMGGRKGWGPRKLRADLRSRGIASSLIDQALTQAYGNRSQEDVVRDVARKRFGDQIFQSGIDAKQRARAYRFLLGRGFEPETIREVLTS